MPAIPKPSRGSALKAKAGRRRALVTADRSENDKVKARSGGQCEVLERYADSIVPYRCTRRAVHVHHVLGGFGVRGRGESAKAENKLHLCKTCHSEIHGHVLIPAGKYWRRVT